MTARLLFPLMLLISVLLHAALLWPSQTVSTPSAAAAAPQPTPLRMVFSQTVSRSAPAEKKPQPAKKPQEKAPPKKPQKQKVAEKPPEKTVEPVPPAPAEPQQTNPEMAAQNTEAAVVAAQQQAAARAGSALIMSEDELQRYIAQLLAHIEAHKFYPPRARQRNIEGMVDVFITLSRNGELLSVSVDGGPRMLRTAARQTVEQQAQPFPAPQKPLPGDTPLHYRMEFALQ